MPRAWAAGCGQGASVSRLWAGGAPGQPARTTGRRGIALIQARASRHADTIGLFPAPGGGWWNKPELS